MYVPPVFAEKRIEVMHRLIEENDFGLLVSQGDDGLIASHLPFLLDRQRGPHGTLTGHLARANPHGKVLAKGGEAMVVFSGPHGYVSPRWYKQHPAVPTWNYASVHAYGTPRVIEDSVALRRILAQLVARHEGEGHGAWSMAGLPEDYTQGMLRGIVGFEIEIARLDGKIKLSQNRGAEDRREVIAALDAAPSPGDRALASLMQELAPPPA